MCADKFDVDCAKSVSYCDDEAVVITFDIKHDTAIFQDTGMAILCFDIVCGLPICPFHFRHPCFERLFGVRMLFVIFN